MAQRTSEDAGLAGPGPSTARADQAPAGAGVSLHPTHFEEALSRPDGSPAWCEVTPEALMPGAAGDDAHRALQALRARFPVSMHGIRLGLGAERDLDPGHLAALKTLFDRYDPCLFSDHLAWSTHEHQSGALDLPPAYDEATLGRVCRHIDQTQELLGRRLLLENPVQHIRLANSSMEETEFLAAVVERTGCGLLLDINNAFINAANSRASTDEYLEAFPVEAIGEIHLGGHEEALDAEGRPVIVEGEETPAEVWSLYEGLIARIGPRPTLIEWRGPAPDWARLDAEGARVNAILAKAAPVAARGF